MIQPSIASGLGSKRPTPPQLTEELLAVGGAIREAAAGAHNLVELIRSQRVGPRSLAKAIPTCVEGAPPEMLRRLEDACQGVLGRRDPNLAVLVQRVVDGQRRLGSASKPRASRLGARARLELEASVAALANDLSVLSGSAELLAAASTPRKVMVELGELLAPAGHAQGEGGALHTDPRIAAAMIELARALSREQRPTTASPDREGRLRVCFARAGGSEVRFGGPSASLVSAAAALLGHSVHIGHDQIELRF